MKRFTDTKTARGAAAAVLGNLSQVDPGVYIIQNTMVAGVVGDGMATQVNYHKGGKQYIPLLKVDTELLIHSRIPNF